MKEKQKEAENKLEILYLELLCENVIIFNTFIVYFLTRKLILFKGHKQMG